MFTGGCVCAIENWGEWGQTSLSTVVLSLEHATKPRVSPYSERWKVSP